MCKKTRLLGYSGLIMKLNIAFFDQKKSRIIHKKFDKLYTLKICRKFSTRKKHDITLLPHDFFSYTMGYLVRTQTSIPNIQNSSFSWFRTSLPSRKIMFQGKQVDTNLGKELSLVFLLFSTLCQPADQLPPTSALSSKSQ